MKKILIIASLFSIICTGYSQYYSANQIRVINNTKLASEGDMYLDTLNFQYYIGLSSGRLAKIGDTLDETIDTIFQYGDSLVFIEGNDTLFSTIITDNDWFKIGTSNAPQSISDSIYTRGDIQLVNYPNNRLDDTTAHINSLYTDEKGNVKSASREIIPPSPYIDISVASTANTFNYYNFYTTQLTNIGLTPIPLANLDFYVYSYDPSIFDNVNINSVGVLTFDVLSNTSASSCIDIRFYTK